MELLSPDLLVKIPSFHVGAKGLAAAWTFMTLDSLGVWVLAVEFGFSSCHPCQWYL